jgi:hypothetical protein
VVLWVMIWVLWCPEDRHSVPVLHLVADCRDYDIIEECDPVWSA